jgi:MFS family permease
MACRYYRFYGRLSLWYHLHNTTNSRALWQCSGYDTGVISAVLVTLGKDLGHVLTSNEQELIISITSSGALVGAIIIGLGAGKSGRLVD